MQSTMQVQYRYEEAKWMTFISGLSTILVGHPLYDMPGL